jgi:cysteine desulfuration protein SufE
LQKRVTLAGGVPDPYGRAVPLTRKLQQVLDDLAVIDDPQERMGLLVDRARRVPALPPSERIEAHRVLGCVSVVWVVAELRDGTCYFRADAESPVVRGLVVFLAQFFSGFTPAAIVAADPDPLEATGLARNLSPTRRNGLNAARAAIRGFAARQVAAQGPSV